jgi:hypothetical protein
MNSLLQKNWYLTVVALLLFTSAGLAQTTTNVTFGSGVGAGGSNIVGSYYVDPYSLTYGGVYTTYAICDDWTNEVSDGEKWTANVTQLPLTTSPSSVNVNPPLFSPPTGSALTQTELYNEVAYLASQLVLNVNNQTKEAEISFALWELTYQQDIDGPNAQTGNDPFTYLSGEVGGTSSSEYLGAEGYLTAAEAESGYNSSGWEVLTPAGTSEGTTSSYPQEMLVHTPESSSVVMLSADIFGLLGLVFLFRRRLFRPIQ